MTPKDQILDEKGTSQDQGREIMYALLLNGFNGRYDELAVALGRPPEEIQAVLHGESAIDDDLLIKVRGVAGERGIDIERPAPD